MPEEKKEYEPEAGEMERLKAETGRSEEDIKAILTQAKGDYQLAQSLIGMRPAQGFVEPKKEGEDPPAEGGQTP